MTKYWIALVVVLVIFVKSCSIVHGADWKEMVREDVSGCTVQSVDYRNSFAKVTMECDYYDGVVIGKSMQTLYISKRGYVIQWGW